MPRDRSRRPDDSRVGRPVWFAALLALAVVVTYANSLGGPFVLDDQAAIVQNLTIRDPWRFGAVLSPEPVSPVAGRPLVNLSFALNYAVGGLDVRGYHVVNIGIHALCALLAFGLVRRTLLLPGLRARFGERASPLAFAAALLWAVHPLNSEVVDYVTQRSESLMALAYLFTLYAAGRALTAKRTAWWTAGAVTACALGMLCKESMATAPLMVALYDRAFGFPSWSEAIHRRRRLYGGLAACWLVLVVIAVTAPRAGTVGLSSGVSSWNYLLNQAAMIARYLRLSVWPDHLVVFYGWPAPLGIGDVALCFLLLLVLAAATIAALVRAPAAGFFGAWFFVTLAPASSIVPIATEVGAERRMYLPLLGLIVLAVVWLWSMWQARRDAPPESAPRFALVPLIALVIVAAALATRTVARNHEYASSLALAQTVVDRYPTAIGYHILGEQLMLSARDGEAVAPLTEAVTRGDSRAGYPLGIALSNGGRLGDAIPRLEAFVQSAALPYRPVPRWLEPPVTEVAGARVLMARIYVTRRDWPAAAAQAQEALRLIPSHPDALRILADAAFSQQQWEEASRRYQQYLTLRPEDAQPLMNLGVARVALGNLNGAVEAFRRAAAADPANPRARDLLTMALKDQQVAAAER